MQANNRPLYFKKVLYFPHRGIAARPLEAVLLSLSTLPLNVPVCPWREGKQGQILGDSTARLFAVCLLKVHVQASHTPSCAAGILV